MSNVSAQFRGLLAVCVAGMLVVVGALFVVHTLGAVVSGNPLEAVEKATKVK